ncbi:hypothetical protein ES288_D12G036100v1 [Gossypium darwinii]|nr:hypothetical protein ES288_D12G036100v1 [Gossypium darwinii]TYH37376.1 hypothetical protein ES332_D12G035900v1 [Gossypium tomentosum]
MDYIYISIMKASKQAYNNLYESVGILALRKHRGMEWLYPRRRGPQWKQGWSGQTLPSMSAPPLPLLTIFGIVLVLLWFSQYADYKAHLHSSAINFQLFLILLPVLLVFFMVSFSSSGRFAFWQHRLERHTVHPSRGSPWGIAILVGLLFVLLFYQSSFQSKWFGPL